MPQKTILFLITVLLFSVQTLAQCPEECKCSENNLVVVDCDYKRLTSLPNNIRSDVQILLLAGNGIRELTSRMFSPFTRLEELDLHYNNIRTVAPDAFSGLTRLEEIYFGNYISVIQEGTFAGLPSLRILFLNSNWLKNLKESVVDDLPDGIRIRLDDNIWICNCSLLAVWRRFHQFVPKQPQPRCWNGPFELWNREWYTFNETDFCPFVPTTSTTLDPITAVFEFSQTIITVMIVVILVEIMILILLVCLLFIKSKSGDGKVTKFEREKARTRKNRLDF